MSQRVFLGGGLEGLLVFRASFGAALLEGLICLRGVPPLPKLLISL